MQPTTFPTKDEIAEAAQILRRGGLVAFPTETVYGLGANALDPTAVRRIFAAKGRPSTSPLIVHVHSIDIARELVVASWPKEAEILARAFWPGPLSLVLPKKPGVPSEVTAGLDTVGVRIPNHPVATALILQANVPVAAPSANPFTHVSPTEAKHVRDSLGHKVDCILDGGRTSVGIESTVLSLAGNMPLLLRPGMISHRELEELIGRVDISSAAAEVQESAGEHAHLSPGLHEKHYSPETPLLLTSSPPAGRGAYVWWKNEVKNAGLVEVRMPSDPGGYARELYSVLHALDKEGLEFIAVEPVADTADWAAIHDRLRRARK